MPNRAPHYETNLPLGHLRSWQTTDLHALHEAFEESREHLRPFLPSASSDPPDLEFRRQWLAEAIAAFDDGSTFSYGIFDNDNEVLAGCGIHPLTESEASIGYWVRASAVRRGIATSAAAALTKLAHDAGWSTVILRHDQANRASRSIAERLRFRLLRTEPHSIEAPGQTGNTLVWANVWARR